MSSDINIDWEREARTGVPEAVLAENKSDTQLIAIAAQAKERGHPMLFTRISQSQYDHMAANCDATLDYDEVSRTMILLTDESFNIKQNSTKRATGATTSTASSTGANLRSVGIVAAGSSDMPVATEVQRCLQFFGVNQNLYVDVGVAGLWRLTKIQPELEKHSVLIAIAGMEGALFSVLAGLVARPIIAVPTSVGYGVATGGTVALHSALASCSAGILTVNIDNGFGAASAARKILLTHNS